MHPHRKADLLSLLSATVLTTFCFLYIFLYLIIYLVFRPSSIFSILYCLNLCILYAHILLEEKIASLTERRTHATHPPPTEDPRLVHP